MGTTTPEFERGSPALSFYYRQFFEDPILREFYGDGGFANLGWWDAQTPDATSAGERLVEQLLALAPRARGRVLDVACGVGGSTRVLSRHFDAAKVTGIGTSEAQLAAAAQRAPGCRFVRTDATQLCFGDASFDLVVCVEAAFHFDTRERFLREALRVLAPGGKLLLSDLCMAVGTPLAPSANHLAGASAYVDLLTRCDFVDAEVFDVTDSTWRAYRRRLNDFVLARASRYASPSGMRALLAANTACAYAIRSSLFARARKA